MKEDNNFYNSIVKVNAYIYFKISNSPTFGGINSCGYEEIQMEVTLPNSITQEDIERVIYSLSLKYSITKEDVKQITKEEFDKSSLYSATERYFI